MVIERVRARTHGGEGIDDSKECSIHAKALYTGKGLSVAILRQSKFDTMEYEIFFFCLRKVCEEKSYSNVIHIQEDKS